MQGGDEPSGCRLYLPPPAASDCTTGQASAPAHTSLPLAPATCSNLKQPLILSLSAHLRLRSPECTPPPPLP